jgi:hypothetical protein
VTPIAHRRAPLALIAGAAALLVLAAAPAFASGATIYMKDDKKGLRFVAPENVLIAGEELKVVNQTDPRKVGPHTFSLVTKGSLPKTSNARKFCFAKGRICRSIAQWHGVKGDGPVKVNPVDAGGKGWDTMGTTSTTGDSWFTGNKPGTSISLPIAAAPPAPTHEEIYFLCAIHPWMQGSVTVSSGASDAIPAG